MAFTDTATVRTHAQLLDTERVPDVLLAQRIADAHAVVLTDLRPQYAASDDPALKLAETEIATAYVLRSLATKAAAEGRDLRTGDFRLDARATPRLLFERAADEERRGWGRLAPFLAERMSRFAFGTVEPAEPGDADWRPEER